MIFPKQGMGMIQSRIPECRQGFFSESRVRQILQGKEGQTAGHGGIRRKILWIVLKSGCFSEDCFYKEENCMKRLLFVSLVLVLGLIMTGSALCADRDAIKKQVDDIVVAMNGGKAAADFAGAAKNDPYVFIMETGGKLLVHPSLVNENLKEKAEPVFNEVAKGTPEGLWVDYTWKEKMKHTYVRKTAGGLIVGSGYSE